MRFVTYRHPGEQDERQPATFIGTTMRFLLPVLSRNSKEGWTFDGSNLWVRDWSSA